MWGTLKKIITYENSLSAREYILDFKLPLISFNQNLGFPLLAESQAGIFQPINLFFNLIFGPLKQINYSIYFHLLLWSSSIYFLLTKIYNVDKNISIYSSIIALISPLIITDLTHQFSLQTFSYLPLSLFIVEKFLINENKRYIFLILLTFCVLFMLLAGNFVYQIVAFSYLFIYTVAAIILTEHSIKNVFIKLLLFILALFLGFLLASFQLIPTFELMQMGSRSDFGDSAYVGSLRPEGFGFFYKSISNDVHKVPGAIGTLGYISIFIYFFHRLFKYFSLKKIDNNKHITQILISSVIVFSISLGKFNPLNDYIYKLVPFLDSMRYPRRWMQVNGLSTILLSAICMNELSKINFKLNKLKTIILCIFLIFLFVLIINIPLLKLLNKNILSLNFLFYLLYPLILIIFSYFIINFFFTKIIKFFFFNKLSRTTYLQLYTTHVHSYFKKKRNI